MDKDIEERFEILEKKLTWLSNENATLHTQVDDDALKRAELEKEFLRCMKDITLSLDNNFKITEKLEKYHVNVEWEKKYFK